MQKFSLYEQENNQNIKGITVTGEKEKISQLADGTSILLNGTREYILKTFKSWGD